MKRKTRGRKGGRTEESLALRAGARAESRGHRREASALGTRGESFRDSRVMLVLGLALATCLALIPSWSPFLPGPRARSRQEYLDVVAEAVVRGTVPGDVARERGFSERAWARTVEKHGHAVGIEVDLLNRIRSK